MKHRVGGRPGGRPGGRVGGGHVHKPALSGPNLQPARSKQVGCQVGTECGNNVYLRYNITEFHFRSFPSHAPTEDGKQQDHEALCFQILLYLSFCFSLDKLIAQEKEETWPSVIDELEILGKGEGLEN